MSKSNLCHVWMTNNLQWGIEHWHLSNSAVVPFLWLRRQDSLHWHRRWYWQWHSYLPEVDFEPDSLRQLTVLFWLDGMRWATKHITIMARASPLIVTVPTPWNMLINDMACSRGCVSEVDWLTFCYNRQRVKNLSQETHSRGECLIVVVTPLTAVQFVETDGYQTCERRWSRKVETGQCFSYVARGVWKNEREYIRVQLEQGWNKFDPWSLFYANVLTSEPAGCHIRCA